MAGESRTVFVFVNPAWGHVTPLKGIVQELIAAGCKVRVYSGKEVGGVFLAAGAEFVDCTRFFLQSEAPLSDAFGFLTALDAAGFMDAFIREEIGRLRPSCALCDMESFWGSLVCEKHGLHTILFSATQIRTLYSAGDYWGGFFRNLEPYEDALERKLEFLAGRGFPGKSLMSLLCLNAGQECVAAIPERWQPYPEQCDPRRVMFMGCSRPLAENALPDPSSRPRIYVTQGTLYHANAAFFRNCVEAFRDMDVEVVMAVWKYIDARRLGTVPDHIRVCTQVDQEKVLKESDAAVFHGGMNTVSDCLMRGIPMIICPSIFDQEANAKRAEETGTGIRVDCDDPAALRDAVSRVLADPSWRLRAAALGRQMRQGPGSAGAARWILTRVKLREKAGLEG